MVQNKFISQNSLVRNSVSMYKNKLTKICQSPNSVNKIVIS